MQAIVVIGCVVALLLVFGVVIVGTRSRQQALNAKIRAGAESLGLVYEPKGERAFRDAWSAVPGLPKRGEVHHVMFGAYDGIPVTCFRHRYVMNTGQSAAVIIHWVFSTDTPHWPEVHVQRRAWLARVCGVRSRVSEDEAFDRAWAIKAKSREFAADLLSSDVRAFLAHPTAHISKWASPRWHFVGGKVCMVVRADIKPEHLKGALDHLVGMWTVIAPA